MKYTLTFILLTLIFSDSRGQNYWGEPFSKVLGELRKKNANVETSVADNGTRYIHFSEGEFTHAYYFDEEGNCEYSLLVGSLDWKKLIVDQFNANKTKISKNKWRDNDNQYVLSEFKGNFIVKISSN